MQEIAHQRWMSDAKEGCRLGEKERSVQVEQADADVDDDVQRAEDHRRQTDLEPYQHPPVAPGPCYDSARVTDLPSGSEVTDWACVSARP